MPDSPLTCTILMEEEVPLSLVTGSGNTQDNDNNSHQANSSTGQVTSSCCNDRHHRKLAICSIICGISCIGIKALINSVKAEQAEKSINHEEAAKHLRQAKKFGLISIITWVSILALTPILMALVSYLLSLKD